MSTESWLLLIMVVIVLAVIVWWWWKRRPTTPRAMPTREMHAPELVTATKTVPPVPVTEAQPIPSAPVSTTAIVPAPAVRSVRADDLTFVEGIGPKIASLLRAAGIETLAQLSVTDTGKLSGILKAAKLQFSDPTTWPEQAALAAAGKMDELKALQDSLKAGRQP